MPSLSETLAALKTVRNGAAGSGGPASDRLTDLNEFDSDPGNLRARTYFPASLADRPALVVVLHGCTQTAADYDRGAGWSALADEQGFALLFPEQRRANNPNLCFNWFSPADTARDGGEALSIRQMIGRLIRDRGIDPARVFVTGLSAGGAMTSVMLATYPELFAGGAILAGLPYGGAANVSQAMERMRGQGLAGAAGLAGAVRQASPHHGPWPTISIWHGDADATVVPANAAAILDQWRTVHGLREAPSAQETIAGQSRRVWRDAHGRDVIETYRIAGMGHGVPLAVSGGDACGAAGPYMLDAGISSTRRIAAFWGLSEGSRADDAEAEQPPLAAVDRAPAALVRRAVRPTRVPDSSPPPRGAATNGIGQVIENALRAAGLLR